MKRIVDVLTGKAMKILTQTPAGPLMLLCDLYSMLCQKETGGTLIKIKLTSIKDLEDFVLQRCDRLQLVNDGKKKKIAVILMN